MLKQEISRRKLDSIIRDALKNNPWTLSNKILYKLCESYPSNTDRDSVLAKTLIIGRVYSAALERGVGEKKTTGSKFYIKNVFPKISSFFSKSDVKSQLKVFKTSVNHSTAIEVHGKFVRSLRGLRKSNKISFASKYLHFHYPDQFYIYDSRAKKAIGILNYQLNAGKKLRKQNRIIAAKSANQEYLKFVSRCKILREKLSMELKRDRLSIREFDTILINIADSIK